jgi:hypothetical protein
MGKTADVEQIIEQVKRTAPGATTLELWIPDQLLLQGKPVRRDVAMSIVGVHLLALNLVPDGAIRGENGFTCRYKRL